jgi:membrane-associated phospholipid phosphatase
MYPNGFWWVALYEAVIIISGLLYAIGITEGITQCVKMFIGRLRPNMYQLCQFNIETLQYSTTVAKERIREGHLSFPSGHSSLASVSMVYCTWYILNYFNRYNETVDQQQLRLANVNIYRNSNYGLWMLLLSVLRILVVALLLPGWAVYVGMTRIVDHWHHVSDVLAGLLLGTAIGTTVFLCVVRPILQHVQVDRSNNEVRSYNNRSDEQSTFISIGANLPSTMTINSTNPV